MAADVLFSYFINQFGFSGLTKTKNFKTFKFKVIDQKCSATKLNFWRIYVCSTQNFISAAWATLRFRKISAAQNEILIFQRGDFEITRTTLSGWKSKIIAERSYNSVEFLLGWIFTRLNFYSVEFLNGWIFTPTLSGFGIINDSTCKQNCNTKLATF